MNEEKKEKYVFELQKQFFDASDEEYKSLNYKLMKLNGKIPNNCIFTSSILSQKLILNELKKSQKKISKIINQKSNIKDSLSLILLQEKIKSLKEYLEFINTGVYKEFERTSGSISLKIYSTDFDPTIKAEYLHFHIDDSEEIFSIDEIRKGVQIILKNSYKFEIYLSDSEKKKIFGMILLPSCFFKDKSQENIIFGLSPFNFIEFIVNFNFKIFDQNLDCLDSLQEKEHSLKRDIRTPPALCYICKNNIESNIYFFECRNCRIKSHNECIKFLIFQCNSVKTPKNLYDFKHEFINSNAKSEFCFHCGQKINKPSAAVECSVCKQTFHFSCSKNTYNSCKLTFELLKEMVLYNCTPLQLQSRNRKLSIDDFNIIKDLGKGASGKVFLAVDKHYNQTLALKIIKKDAIDNPLYHQLIKSEKYILKLNAKHNFPFVCKMICEFEDKENVFLGMQYLPGGDLLSILREKEFSEDQIRFYVCEIVLGLEFLHKIGVAYRDLKLSNLLLDEEGHVVICDFGISKPKMKNNMKTYTFCGTIDTIAPEILMCQGYEKTVDFWSLGAAIYEMFHKKSPFSSDDPISLLQKIISTELNFDPNVSKHARDFISSLLEINSEKRLGWGYNGIEEIKNHPWFKEINWKDVEKLNIKPEYIPNVYENGPGISINSIENKKLKIKDD